MQRRPLISVSTIGDLIDRRAEDAPDRLAVVFPEERASFQEVAVRTDELGRALMGLGVRAGDRVAMLLPNSLDMYLFVLASVKIGAVAVPVNSRYKITELGHVLANSGARILVTTTAVNASAVDFVELLRQTVPALFAPGGAAELPELDTVVCLGDPGRWPGSVTEAELSERAAQVSHDAVQQRAASVKLRDPAFLVYTSGTTAQPKGAVLSHEAVVRLARGVCDRLSMTDDDVVWSAIPLFHGGGLSFAVICLTSGCTLAHAGHFDASMTPAYLERERVSVAFAAFETIWLPVLDRPDLADRDLSRLRVVVIVGVPERLEDFATRLPQAVHVSTIAMTESSAYLCLGSLDDPRDRRLGTGGRPLPGMECRVIDPDGRDVEVGVPGELLFRGPNAFDGYFRAPEQTAAAIDAGGWFHSGDLVVGDSGGRLTFLSRLRDMLKVGGENVAAAEVEGYLLSHPAVSVVAVVAAPDAYYGQVPAAFIQLRPEASVTAEEIIEFCLGRIATFRVPRYVRFVDEWPMSGTKIQKYRLREQLAAELESHGVHEAPRLRSGRRTPG